MNNNVILLKVKQRLNKLSSNDYENLPSWAIIEAFNKAQSNWCRRNTRGENAKQEGDEQSISRIDDLEQLMSTTPPLSVTDKGIYLQTSSADWPSDYLRYKRFALTAVNTCCPTPQRMVVYLGEEANVDIYLNDFGVKPDYNWAETFATIGGNKINIYHNKQFSVSEFRLIYYRQPTKIQIMGVKDPYTGLTSTQDVECEFADDLTEVMCDEAASILAGDIESIMEYQRLQQAVEKNN